MTKALALLEVLVVFVAALAALAIVAGSPFAQWERAHLYRPFAEYVALGLVPLAVILLGRRPLSSWGISSRHFRTQLDASLKCLLPFAAGKAITYALSSWQPLHWFAEPIIALAVLVACAWLLRPKATPTVATALVVVAALPAFLPFKAVSALIFYPLFLGPSEELLFRGYIQSRLNCAFGRPFRFGNASCGAGLLFTAVIFSAFHVLNLPQLFAGRIEPLWFAAAPTFAWGLAFGYLRERTGSLLPPAVVHGVPQGLAWAVLGR